MSRDTFQERVDVYDALIDWPKRLTNETPFYRAVFERVGVRSVLDVACGTGHHAAMFHDWGLRVEGADLSPAMIARCREQFGQSEALRWVVRAFEEAPAARGSFDAVVCVGNSLALVADFEAVERAVRAMLAALRPGGVCVLQVLNLWHLRDGPCVWQKCLRTTLDRQEHILLKGVHRCGTQGFVELIDLAVTAHGAEPRADSVKFLGLEQEHVAQMLTQAGGGSARFYGSFQQAPYRRAESQDLIVVAEK